MPLRDLLERVLPHPAPLDRHSLQRSLALLLAFSAAAAGLHTILEDFGWWLLCVLLAVVVFGAGALARRLGLGRILSPIVSALALAMTMIVTFAADVSALGILPTAGTAQRFAVLFRDSGYSITWQSVPATADPAILFVLGLGFGALALLAELATFSLRVPALVGLPLTPLFLVPGTTPQGETDGVWFAATAGCFLWLLLIGSPRRLVPALSIGAAAIVGGLVLPAALPSTDIAVTSSELGPSVSTGVNPMIRLGDSLRRGQERLAFTYSTVSGEPYYLRLVEISDFFSNDWAPSQPRLDPDNRVADFARPPGLGAGVSTRKEVGYLHMGNLRSPWLPVPYPTSSIRGLSGDWQWIPQSLSVASNVSLATGENYTVSSVVLEPTPEQLLDAGSDVPSGMRDYLALPELPAIVSQTAQQVTAGESTSYEKALALQEFLRSRPFRYSEKAPVDNGYDGTGVDVVGRFLEEHSGYCIHFSSAMAVMARDLGIPSRLIVGFQPGSLSHNADNGRRLFEVTTHDLHSWPELFFDGIGWVRFEPTPTRGDVPDYARPGIGGVPATVPLPGQGPGGPVGPGQDSGIPQVDAGPTVARWLTSGDWSSWLVGGLAALALVSIVLTPATLRRMRRSRRIARLRAGRGSAVSAWHEVLETAADVGVSLSSTLTLRDAVDRLRRVRGMTDAGRAALERLGAAVEREGYARRSAWTLANPDDLLAVLACLKSGIPPRSRMQVALWPPSLVARTMRALTGDG